MERTVASTLKDPQFKAGRWLIDQDRLEEAVDFFSGLLETRVGVFGDEMCPALAPLYYEYGNALLYNAEESGAVFGDAITDAEKQKAMAILEAASSAQTAVNTYADQGSASNGHAQEVVGETPDAAAGSDERTPAQEAEEDLELAWMQLEMARRVYESQEMTDDIRAAVAKVGSQRPIEGEKCAVLSNICRRRLRQNSYTFLHTARSHLSRRLQVGSCTSNCGRSV